MHLIISYIRLISNKNLKTNNFISNIGTTQQIYYFFNDNDKENITLRRYNISKSELTLTACKKISENPKNDFFIYLFVLRNIWIV